MIMLKMNELPGLLKLFNADNIKYAGNDFSLTKITGSERDSLILQIVNIIYHGNLKESGEHRQNDWERGWAENLIKLSNSENATALLPGYFSSNSICRINSDLYQANSSIVEANLLKVIQIDLLKKFSLNASHVYEFGCGSGNNLFNIREAIPNAKITGLDWAISSQNIISKMQDKGLLDRVEGKNFNFFEPDFNFSLDNNSTVLTCAALEQVGHRWGAFIQYLLDKSPKLVINIEPISELLDMDNLLDRLSIEYALRRKYLIGYYNGLIDLQNRNKINILYSSRSALGSKYINGYSIVVWEIC